MKHPLLASRVFNTPLLVHPQKLDAIIAGVGQRLLGAEVDNEPALVLPADAFSTKRGKPGDSGYVVHDGVAVVSANGALVHRSRGMEGSSTYLLGYDRLAAQLEAAMADPEVHAVMQIFDSPGGEVAGAFEYGDRIHALRGRKPMRAIADSMAASAAYLGGSAFDQIAVSSTGWVGSIGVVMRHVDMSRALANEGVQVTHIFAGEHKVDGNPYQALPQSVRDDLQAEVDSIYAMFVDAVARNRAGLSADAIRATQARTYRGAEAVSMGLADRVATADQVLSELVALRARSVPVGHSARSSASNQGGSMSGNTQGGQSAAQTPPTSVVMTRESLERDHPAVFAEVLAVGAERERERVASVRAQLVPGHEAVIERMVADGKSTGAEAAMAMVAAVKAAHAAAAAAHTADAPLAVQPSAANDEGSSETLSREQQRDKAKAYAAEHKVSFTAALKSLGYAA